MANDAITHFHEAITAVRAQAAAPQPPETMVRDALKAYLRSLDPYSGYLTPQEYATGKDVADAAYAGVGMDLFPDHDGSLVCIPFPGGPAAQAGVRYGDVLVAVDGAPVRGLGVLDIGVRVRGQKGSPVSLAVASPGASPRTVELKRDTIAFRSVAVFAKAKPLPVIRIYRFGDATRRELKKAIASIGLLTDKIIDLRGTIGGDLEEAMACAKLFLESGQTIASLHSPSGEVVYTVDREPSDLFSRLFIWQDRMTAGEAEAFVSGLVLNGRAMSMGQRTFGKGSVQSVVGLSDGSAVVVTHGLLHAANGKVFDGVGLEPDVSIPPESAGDDAFFAKEVEKALKPGLL
ncbi:MAG: S41 family peptidase [Desulfovibrionaceae bacterium]